MGLHFAAGLASGLVSSILLQPADLLKTRVQQSHSHTLLSTLRSISHGPNPMRQLWRGTLPSVLRTSIGSALYFSSLNALRQHISLGALVIPTSPSSSSSLPKLSPAANLATGALARASVGFFLMPITVLKVRYESSLYAYRSLWPATLQIWRAEGLRGFFSGFGATAVRDAPYAGLYVLFYEAGKTYLSHLASASGQLPGSIGIGGLLGELSPSTSASINFGSGLLAAGLATAITNPFDAIKTRIQLLPQEYGNMIWAARKIVREDGFRSLFDGLGLRMARKALSSAMAWTLYEEVVRRAALNK
ncbi:MAG: hypothetical protein M1829_000696 [Trizodia sp. TS-e1964]|nr:MAG: hypothetical protein M1829_000696 [Trizodia sp. TS-e1964]